MSDNFGSVWHDVFRDRGAAALPSMLLDVGAGMHVASNFGLTRVSGVCERRDIGVAI